MKAICSYCEKENELKFTEFHFISNIHNLLDDECKKLVFKPTIRNIKNNLLVEGFESYYDYHQNQKGYHLATAKESFLSALEAEGVLFENPNGKKPHLGMFIEQKANCVQDFDKALKEWKEAEKNVFGENTLVFVEQ